MNVNAIPPNQNLTATIEHRVRSLIGELMVNNAALVAQVEMLQAELKAAQARLEELQPKEAIEVE